jgi:hypothetical protein
MWANYPILATLLATDLARARRFYIEKLGLTYEAHLSLTRIHDTLMGMVAIALLKVHELCFIRNRIVGCLHCEKRQWPIDLSGDNTFGHRLHPI